GRRAARVAERKVVIMKRTLTSAALFVVALVATPAHAQYPLGPATGPGYNPPVSPYLNLVRRGTDPAINYFGLVRPEIAFQRSISSLQQQVNTVGAMTAADAQANYQLATGHPIVFNNYSHYFGGSLTGAAGPRPPVGGRAAGPTIPPAGASGRPTIPR